jgi:hypothetical protein
VCINAASCSQGDYGTPEVPIDLLPAVALDLVDALANREPSGLTPTAPALSGALQHAAAYTEEHPSEQVVAVLATDGFPTQCLPADATSQGDVISDVADRATAGLVASPSIKTFVIGVFTPDEASIAQLSLDIIANAGGSDSAFIIDTTSDVTAQFLAALSEIRENSLRCEYEIPTATDGDLDYFQVNVEIADENQQASTLFNVPDAASCDPAALGWHYDVNPADGTPGKIVLCSSTCNAFKNRPVEISIALGCQTVQLVK